MFKQAVLLASLLLTGASSSPPTSQRIVEFSRYHDMQGSPLSNTVDIPNMTLKAQATTVYRPRSLSDYHSARMRSARHGESQRVDWDPVEVLGPNVQDIHTLSQLARMSANAYALPGQKNWYDLDVSWNTVNIPHSSYNTVSDDRPRAFRTDGRTPRMASEAMSSYHRITLLLCSLSKEQQFKAVRPRRINLMIICS